MYDGMQAEVVEKGSNYLYLATRQGRFTDLFTLGYYPKPNYDQIGVFDGNTEGIEEGDTVEVYFKHEGKNLKKIIKIMLMNYGNIQSVRKVKSGNKLSRIEKIKDFFSFKA